MKFEDRRNYLCIYNIIITLIYEKLKKLKTILFMNNDYTFMNATLPY